MGRFNDATKLQKTVCAIISIAAFLLIWFLATNGTELGVVLASPVEMCIRDSLLLVYCAAQRTGDQQLEYAFFAARRNREFFHVLCEGAAG